MYVELAPPMGTDPSPSTGSPSAPRVSIGIPVYNSETFLPAAIESVLTQTFTDIELIICDNASTDRSFAVCQEYAARDSRVRLLRNSVNLGANPNYRKVEAAARGEFFKWASANDLIAPDFVERCLAALERRPDAVVAFARTLLFDGDPRAGTEYDDALELQDDDPFTRYRRCVEGLRLNNVINGLIRSASLRRTPVMPDYHSSDNVVLAYLTLEGKFVRVPETAFYRRMDLESATRLQPVDVVRLHHYPTDRFKSFFQGWQLNLGYLGAVVHSQLPLGRKLSALTYVAHQFYWQLPRLLGDVREAFRFYLLGHRSRRN